MARVLAGATNVSFQLVCRAWLHRIAVNLLFMPKPLAERSFEENDEMSFPQRDMDEGAGLQVMVR